MLAEAVIEEFPHMRLSQQHRPSTWAPKALAIVSFALAMLAMQPMVDAGTVDAGRTVLVKEVSGPQSSEPRLAPFKTTAAAGNRAVRETLPAAHLHILATVEILHRLFIAELNLQPAAAYFPWLPFHEQPCVAILPPATAIRFTIASRHEALAPPPAERAFAIAHFLLAPPIA